MPRCEQRNRVQKPPVVRRYDHPRPTFSSTLLDSVYRSIVDDDHNSKPTTRGAPDPYRWSSSPPPNKEKHSSPAASAVTRPLTHDFRSSTSSSSDNSSYGGFSSSEPESASCRGRVGLRPIRTEKIRPANHPLPPQPHQRNNKRKQRKENIKKNLTSIKNKLRSPTSPAARLAGFLNSLFTPKPPKTVSDAGAGSAHSSAASFSRSCMTKKMTSAVVGRNLERSVRFQLPADGASRRREESRCPRKPATAMTSWRRSDGGEEEEDDVASDASSDLFELENLSAVGRYRDELPVFQTTRIGGLVL